MKQVVDFIGGMPRTGSTLLTAILNQNPRLLATPTSPFYPLLVKTNEAFNTFNLQFTYSDDIPDRVYSGFLDGFYPPGRYEVVFDKHRGWAKHVESIKRYINPNPRIICTVRPIAEIISSYLKLIEGDSSNFVDNHLRKDGVTPTWESRAYLLWTQYMQEAYESTAIGLEKYSENIMIVQYKNIVYKPKETIDSIYQFCKLQPFTHNFDEIVPRLEETKDEGWGLKDLHKVRPSLDLSSINPSFFMSSEAIDYFNSFNDKIGVSTND